jgi:DNA repair protein RadA/Sms
MAKPRNQFVCRNCGTASAKWEGKCSGCGEWNTLEEEISIQPQTGTASRNSSQAIFERLDAPTPIIERTSCGSDELDRVLGGGLVRGSAILIGGEPGIGKSTLLLQTAAHLASKGEDVAYVSGEESLEQIRLRARRLGLAGAPVRLASTGDAWTVAQAIRSMRGSGVAIVDSIQTMSMAGVDSAPGSVSQIRSCAHELIRAAKDSGVPLFLVGHVTKDGTIAGPKILEHAVDTVAYFSGDASHEYRLVRTVKNRFGATDEIGVFAMSEKGLREVANPSEMFLSDHRGDAPGSAVYAGMEGTRPLLVEVQALVAAAAYGSPRRTVVGWDSARLATLLAVLEARCGTSFADVDVYLNVVGGFRVSEPGADLAIAAALISAKIGRPLPPDLVLFGEVGLGGEIRPVGQTEARLREAAKLGFSQAIRPKARREGEEGTRRKEAPASNASMQRLSELVGYVAGLPQGK